MDKKEKKILEAAALRYNAQTDDAPYLVAMGKGEIAEKIVQTARENDIPVMEDAPLAHILNKLSLGDEIPEELYGVVAQVLAFIANLDHKGSERFGLKYSSPAQGRYTK